DDLVDHALRHGQRAIADVDGQEQFGDRVESDPHPVRRPPRALDAPVVADLPRLDRTEQGVQFIELHLRDVHVVQEILREGLEMVGGFDEPLQHCMRVHLEDTGDGTDAQTLSQCADGPHQKLRWDTLAMQRGAMGFEEVALAGRAMQLPPGTTAGMAIRADVAETRPATIATIGVGTKMARGVDLTAAPPDGDEPWGGGAGRFTGQGDGLRTGVRLRA